MSTDATIKQDSVTVEGEDAPVEGETAEGEPVWQIPEDLRPMTDRLVHPYVVLSEGKQITMPSLWDQLRAADTHRKEIIGRMADVTLLAVQAFMGEQGYTTPAEAMRSHAWKPVVRSLWTLPDGSVVDALDPLRQAVTQQHRAAWARLAGPDAVYNPKDDDADKAKTGVIKASQAETLVSRSRAASVEPKAVPAMASAMPGMLTLVGSTSAPMGSGEAVQKSLAQSIRAGILAYLAQGGTIKGVRAIVELTLAEAEAETVTADEGELIAAALNGVDVITGETVTGEDAAVEGEPVEEVAV